MNTLPGKAYFQQRQRNRLYETVLRIVDDATRLDGMRRKDIAVKLGSNPSQVSRWLSGPSNWTIDSISDVLWAVGGELDFNFMRFADKPRQNRSHPTNDIAVQTPSQAANVNRMSSSTFSGTSAIQSASGTSAIQTAVVELL